MAHALAYMECPLPPCCTLLKSSSLPLYFNYGMRWKIDSWALPTLNISSTADLPICFFATQMPNVYTQSLTSSDKQSWCCLSQETTDEAPRDLEDLVAQNHRCRLAHLETDSMFTKKEHCSVNRGAWANVTLETYSCHTSFHWLWEKVHMWIFKGKHDGMPKKILIVPWRKSS